MPGLRIRGRDLLACALFAAAPIVSAYFALAYLQTAARISKYGIDVLWTAAYSLSLIGAVWLVFVRGLRASFAELGWRQISWRAKLAAAAIGLASLGVSWAAFEALGAAGIDYGDYSLGFSSETRLVQALTLAAFAGIIGPIAEEIFYRGILFRWMRQRASFWPAAIGSSILFGFAHIQTAAIANAAIAGVVFAILYERSGSLLVPAIAHQAWNFTIVMASWIAEVAGA